MIVCLCEAVSHRVIDAAIDEGASNVRDVGRRCGAGTGCGMCKVDIKARLEATREGLTAFTVTTCEPRAGEPIKRHDEGEPSPLFRRAEASARESPHADEMSEREEAERHIENIHTQESPREWFRALYATLELITRHLPEEALE